MAHKSGNQEDFEFFSHLNGPEAKKAGKKVVLRPDWDVIKFDVMREALEAKFTQNPNLAEKLLATGDAYIEETNSWKDVIWGVCDGVGENHLGKLLMELRDKLKNE